MKLFLLLIALTFTLPVYAQTCNGSLGDPVINQNFGAGADPGLPLPAGITDMTYTTNNCPPDGSYTIATSLTGSANTHPYTWYNVPHDHSGNPNGYMMIINASYAPSIFFTQQAPVLCPNTIYFFSAYILNLMIPGPITASYTHPDITFSIETTDGQVLATGNTGVIPASTANQGPTWVPYSIPFTTPVNVTSVIVKMTNNAPGGNGNDFILDDITFQACGPIIQGGFGGTEGSATKYLCQGSNARYTLKTQVITSGTPSYQWQYNYHGVGWTDIYQKTDDSLNIGFVNADTGTYKYRLGVANGSAITNIGCRVYSPTLTVSVNPLPVVPPIPDQTVCEGEPLQLMATGGTSYTWTRPNRTPTSQNPLIINKVTDADAGTYTVVALSDSSCAAAPVKVNVMVVPAITPAISGDIAICAGESTRLASSGGLYYKWTPSAGLDRDDIPNPLAAPLQTTTYKVVISNGGCSDSSKTITVTVNQNPVANAGDNIVLFEGQSAKLNGSVKGDNITGVSWTPAIFLSDPESLNPITTPTDDITYTLTAVSQTCGTSTSKVSVKVYKKITVPNAFSPNNDGVNDYWNIDALATYHGSAVLVYNRYGHQVYQSTGYAKPWDGTLNGSPLPEGTYYYIIDLKNNTPKISGWVLIIR